MMSILAMNNFAKLSILAAKSIQAGGFSSEEKDVCWIV